MTVAVYSLAMATASGLWALNCWVPAAVCVLVAGALAFKNEARRLRDRASCYRAMKPAANRR